MAGRSARSHPTKRSIQYVVRLGGASRVQLEAVQAYENERLGDSGASLTIADVLRDIIERAAAERGLAFERSPSSPLGLRIELQRGRAARARPKKAT